MADNPQTSGFAPFAGQIVASGIGTNLPIQALEDSKTLANLSNIKGLTPKIKDVFIRETRIFNNPIDKYVTKFDSRFGAGMEQAAFKQGVANSKLDGTCMPWGDADMVSQMNLTNFAYDIDVHIRDHEVDKVLLDEGQLGSYMAEKMKLPMKTLSQMKYRAWVQLISDVTDGTRSIASKTSSDGTGVDVTYSPTVTGYAGQVETVGTGAIPAVERGKLATIGGGTTDALAIAQTLEGRAADMRYEASDLNELGASTFVTGTPLLIMEEKVLNALDAVFANANASATAIQNGYGYAGFPTKTFRDYVGRFAEICEIDSFATLPTNVSYEDVRLGAVLMDRDMLVEKIEYADVESFRCAKERATGYSYQGSSTMSIWKGLDAYAMLFNTNAS